MSKTPMSVPKPLLPRKKLNFLHIWTCSKKKKKKKKKNFFQANILSL